LPLPPAYGKIFPEEGGENMDNKTVEKLALIYVQTKATAETTPAQLYELYVKAAKEIREAEGIAIEPTV
jgi:hypothetical protein